MRPKKGRCNSLLTSSVFKSMISKSGVHNSTMTSSGKPSKGRQYRKKYNTDNFKYLFFKKLSQENSFNLLIYSQKLNNGGRTLAFLVSSQKLGKNVISHQPALIIAEGMWCD